MGTYAELAESLLNLTFHDDGDGVPAHVDLLKVAQAQVYALLDVADAIRELRQGICTWPQQ